MVGGLLLTLMRACRSPESDTGAISDTGLPVIDDDGDGYAAGTEDYDDGDADINPGMEEEPGNGVDEDCDGSDAGPTSELGDASAV